MKSTFVVILLIGFGLSSFAQNITQNVRGQVTDAWTKTSLPGANVILVGSNPPVGTVTDVNGYYELTDVPVGRVGIKITFIGYEEKTITNIQLESGKELVLDVELFENITEIQGVEIVAEATKTKSNNDMSTVSSRAFTIEESERFAGARNDVARMASNFAGVNTSNDASNDIVIRGNSPNGLLWRLEGIDIPNPNHFGGTGSTGGPVSMLNNNVLANSDFLTGAFPAEYGNANSGVFDLQMRNGNSSKHEFLLQMGLNGLEAGAEGPINKERHSSYLVNYRYSTLGIFKAMGIDFGTGAAVPDYQDLSFKANLPTKKMGRFTVFGLAGNSTISFLESEKDPEEQNLYSGNQPQDIYANTRMATVGFSNIYLLNENTFIRTIGAVSVTEDDTRVDSLDVPDLSPHFLFSRKFNNSIYQLDVSLNKKLNAKNKVKIGMNYRWLLFDMADKYYSSQSDYTRLITGYKGNTNFIQAYAEWQLRATERLTFNTGLHGQYLVLNGSNAIEPRIGAKYQLASKHYLGMAYGLHSQMAPMDIYFSVQRDNMGNAYNPNQDLDFTKSHHYVLSYDWNFSNTARFRTEVYYQYLFNTVIDRDTSFWALLNRTTFNDGNPDFMTNEGTGTNYGVEFTLEQFMNHGFYGLLTSSFFRSSYLPSDGIKRSTAFDSRYVINLVSGKEFLLGKKNTDAKRKKWFCLDGKISYAGGRRYIPIDEAQSTIDGKVVWDEKNAFSQQFDPYFRADVRFAYRISGKKASQEWALDVQNITNAQNPYLLDWNTATNEVEIVYQLGLFPVVQYKIEF